MTDTGIRSDICVVTDHDAFANNSVTLDMAARADGGVRADHHTCADLRSRADGCTRMHPCARMNARLKNRPRIVKGQDLRKGEAGIAVEKQPGAVQRVLA